MFILQPWFPGDLHAASSCFAGIIPGILGSSTSSPNFNFRAYRLFSPKLGNRTAVGRQIPGTPLTGEFAELHAAPERASAPRRVGV
jgi:hypothetical protein